MKRWEQHIIPEGYRFGFNVVELGWEKRKSFQKTLQYAIWIACCASYFRMSYEELQNPVNLPQMEGEFDDLLWELVDHPQNGGGVELTTDEMDWVYTMNDMIPTVIENLQSRKKCKREEKEKELRKKK